MDKDPTTLSTRWSIISGLYGEEHEAAWNQFIRRYRSYVAAVLRRVGLPAHGVDAATEQFWGYLYSSRASQRADRDGRFRSYLSGVLRNYARKWRRDHAGAVNPVEEVPDEPQVIADDTDLGLWAEQIVHLGLTSLGREHPDDEQILRWYFGIADSPDQDCAPVARIAATAIAERLGRTANAVHQALHRARARLRRRLEQEVAMTVTQTPEQREELHTLIDAINRLRPGLPEGRSSEP